MAIKPTYEELEKRIQDLENEISLSHKEYDSWRQESKYGAIFNQSFQFALVLDSNGIVIEMNELCRVVCGPYAENVIGGHFSEAGWWKEFDEVKEKTDKAISQTLEGEVVRDEVFFIDKGKNVRHGTRIFSPIKNVIGEIIMISVVGLDISDIKAVSERLTKSNQRLEQAHKIARIGHWDWEMSTGELTWSDEIFDIFGRDKDSFKPTTESFEACIHPDDYRDFINEREAALAANRSVDIEHRISLPNGTIRYVQELAEVFRDNEGKVIRVLGTVQDITERKLAELSLRKSEEKYRTLFEGMAQGVFYQNCDGQLIDFNKKTLEIFGLTKDQLLGRTSLDPTWKVINQDGSDLPGDQHPSMVALRTGKPVLDAIAGVFNTIKKEYVWININAIPQFRIGEVEPYQVFVSMHDISDLKQSEDTLRQSEALMESVFRAAPTGIGVVGDRAIKAVNDTFCNMLGYSREELIGQRSTIVYPSIEEFEKVGQEKYEQIKEKGTGTVETIFKRKDGNTIDVILSSTPIDINDLSKGVTFTALDISKKKKAESSLIKAHKLFLTVLNGIDSTVYVADMETYEILFMNNSMIESFGEDYTGEKCWKVFRRKSGPCSFCSNCKLIDNNGNPTGVHTWHDENPITGKWYINHDRAIEWIDGRVVRLQIATDISEIKKMEQQLLQAQKMESVGRLAGGIAHDFNNMLSIILGNVEIIIDDIETSSPLVSNLEEVQKAAKRSADLTRQLLAFARKQTIAPKILNLNETIDGMLKMLRRLIGEDIGLLWQPGNNVWPVRVDPSQIDQILANLCVNARDAIADVGKVIIETSNTEFDETYCSDHPGFLPGEFVLLAVSDNGCGMDIKTLENIYEPFYTTKKLGEGTGLGLSTVYGVVKQNNGFINAYSEPGQGTTFNLYFPRYKTKAGTSPEKEKDHPIERGHETIFLVEDEVPILRMTEQMLERLGYQVVSARTPGEAIRLAQEYEDEIHLLMTDVVMPEMNGRDLAKNILSIHPDLKRLFMSGYTANVIAHHGVLDAGVNFIQKPFSREELGKKVREALDMD